MIQKLSDMKESDLIPCQGVMDTQKSNFPEEVMCQCPRWLMALPVLRENSGFGRTSQHLTFPALWWISQESLEKTLSPNQIFCFLCHGLALNSTFTKLYTMQIKKEINKATPKQWRSLFEMLYQENNNRERRLNSKGMAELEPIKATDVW